MEDNFAQLGISCTNALQWCAKTFKYGVRIQAFCGSRAMGTLPLMYTYWSINLLLWLSFPLLNLQVNQKHMFTIPL